MGFFDDIGNFFSGVGHAAVWVAGAPLELTSAALHGVGDVTGAEVFHTMAAPTDTVTNFTHDKLDDKVPVVGTMESASRAIDAVIEGDEKEAEEKGLQTAENFGMDLLNVGTFGVAGTVYKLAAGATGVVLAAGAETTQILRAQETERREKQKYEQRMVEEASTLIDHYHHLDEEQRVNALIVDYYNSDAASHRHAAQLHSEANFDLLLREIVIDRTF